MASMLPTDEIEAAKKHEQEVTPNSYHHVYEEYPAKKRERVLLEIIPAARTGLHLTRRCVRRPSVYFGTRDLVYLVLWCS